MLLLLVAYAFNKSLGAAPKAPLEPIANNGHKLMASYQDTDHWALRYRPSPLLISQQQAGRRPASLRACRGLDVMSRYVASQAEARTKLELHSGPMTTT